MKDQYTKEEVREMCSWLMEKCEYQLDRIIENEEFLLKYMELPFWKRWFFGQRMILEHLKKIIKNDPYSPNYDL